MASVRLADRSALAPPSMVSGAVVAIWRVAGTLAGVRVHTVPPPVTVTSP